MKYQEKKVLDLVNAKVVFMLNNNFGKDYIAEYLDDVIAELSEDCSSELFSTLYRMQDNLLLGSDDYE